MINRVISLIVSSLMCSFIAAQPIIYKDTQTLITGFWADGGTGGSASIQEETGQNPYEGNNNYRFDYNFTNYWAGCGLNMDNWGVSSARDFSGYTHLRIAYYGLSTGINLNIRLRNGGDFSNSYTIGGSIPTYQVIDIPISALLNGTSVNATAITEIELSISGSQSASGSLYFDAVELVNTSDVSQPASAATWALANSVTSGVNLANWLEAHWLIPFNAFPDVGKYNRTNIQGLKDAGFEIIRLPITFERITPTTSPYTVDFNHQALKLVDSMIVWAAEFDFKLIIDNHHGYELTDANYTTELPRLEAIWTQISSRYHNLDPNRYLFEVYNEPHSISDNNFRTVAQALVDIVRANETNTHSIIVGASGYNSGSNLTSFVPLNDADIIYGFHNYDPYFFTHQGMSWTTPAYFPSVSFPQSGEVNSINSLFLSVKSWSNTNDVPVWLGEYGVATSADATSRCNWIETLVDASETNGFAHFYWDALSPSDAFGFYDNGVISSANVISCFSDAMGLYNTILPIRFLDLNVECNRGKAKVTWQTQVSEEQYLFVVEGSIDGITWAPLGKLIAVDGIHRSRLNDDQPKSFYRIKTIAQDGLISYSPVIGTSCGTSNSSLSIFPNPAKHFFQIGAISEKVFLKKVQIFDISGKLIMTPSFYHEHDPISVDHLVQGHYVVQALLSTGEILRQKLIILP